MMQFNRAVLFAAFLACAGLAPVPADDVKSALPSAESILGKYVEATGGRAAYEKIHTTMSTGTFELPAAGLKGAIKIYNQEPDKSYSVVELAGIGKIEEGCDGTTAWQLSALQGARIKSGSERAMALRASSMKTRLDWHQNFKSIETVGSDTVDGKPVYVVLLTPKEGKPEKEFYDKASGLLLKESMIMATPMGEIPTESTFSDYRSESGLVIPHRLGQSAVGQQFAIVIDSFTINNGVPKDRFELPPQIKALVQK